MSDMNYSQFKQENLEITAVNFNTENLVSPKSDICNQKVEVFSTEIIYTGDTVHEEEIQDNNLMQHVSKAHEGIKLRIKEYNFESESNKSDAIDLILLDMPVNSEKALKKRNSNTSLSTDVNVKRCRNHYVCQVCNETFATNYILKKHTASVHEFEKSSLNDANSDFDSEIDPLDVSVDLSRIKSNGNYVSVVHEKEKKLKCDRCDSKQKFARKRDLNRHIKIAHELFHEANRPYKCEKCDAEFTKENHLKDHITAIHDENRPHKCKKCSLAFSFSTDLINHVSVVHNGKKPGTHNF